MDTTELEAASKRFDFASWKGLNRLDRELLVKDVTLPGDLVPGFESARIREIDPGDQTRLLRVSWDVPAQNAVLVADIRECESRDRAHEVLLEYLANMQAPDVRRLEDNAPGDVAFARNSTVVLFARGNIAFSIRNGGPESIPVGDVARSIDEWIVTQDR